MSFAITDMRNMNMRIEHERIYLIFEEENFKFVFFLYFEFGNKKKCFKIKVKYNEWMLVDNMKIPALSNLSSVITNFRLHLCQQ